MSDTERVDALVLGSGQGGKLLAWHMAQAVLRAAVIAHLTMAGGLGLLLANVPPR